MKINKNDAILTPRVLLVPYNAHHVPTYHEWMQDEQKELQKLTASEPLTLSEEYAMQASWRQDADKLTFIICTSPPTTTPELADVTKSPGNHGRIIPGKQDAAENMLGDVNLFLFNEDEDADEGNGSQKENKHRRQVVGELEIMIAQKEARGKGIAKEALAAFIWYMTTSISAILAEYGTASSSHHQRAETCVLTYLRVKIDKDNIPSINLFQKLGFVRTSSEPNFFGEVELRTPFANDKLADVEEKIGTWFPRTKLAYGDQDSHED